MNTPDLPPYGDVAWETLFDAISMAMIGVPGRWKPDSDHHYPGHQMVTMNLNSLNRIVSGFAAAAVLAERERAACIAEGFDACDTKYIAAAIRAEPKKEQQT